MAAGWIMVSHAMAQNTIDSSTAHAADTTTHVIDNVTVTGHRVPSSLTASSPAQSLSHEQMVDMGSSDIGDAMKHLAGVQVKDYGGIGGMKTVDIRGLGAQHTGVSYDGVQVGDCQSGQVDLSRFTLDNISTLRLTIGQGDDIYQSAKSYACAGLIEVSSLRRQQDGRPFVSGTFKLGSYGLVEPSLLYAQTFSRLTVNAFTSYQHANGNYRFKMWNGTHLIDEDRYNSDISAWRGELNLSYSLTPRQTISWKLYGFDADRGLPGAVVYDNTYAAERLRSRNVFTQLFYENIVSEKVKLKAAAKWNYTWDRDRDQKAGGPTEDIYRQNETYLTATLWTEPVSDLHVSLAQDFAHNYLSMTVNGCPYPTRNSWWTALAANYTGVRNVTINASLLSTHIHESVKAGEPSKGFNRLSPAFSLQWNVMRGMRLRAGYKDIFRTPTLNDLYYTSVGRRSLKPEKTRQWNIGATYSHDFCRSAFVALTLDGYYGKVDDKIVAVPRMFLWQMMNVDKVRMLGIDATAAAGFAIAKGWEATVTATYNYMDATNRTDKSNVNYGDQISYTPRNSGSGILTLHSPIADITYNVLLTGGRYMLDYNIPKNRISGFADHSVSIHRTFVMGPCRLRAQLDIQNIGNKNYEVIRFYPMPGRNVKLSVNIQW